MTLHTNANDVHYQLAAPALGFLIRVTHHVLMTPTLAEIETLEPNVGDIYTVGIRSYCGRLHHMTATARELAPLIAW